MPAGLMFAATALMFGTPSAVAATTVVPKAKVETASGATDFGARRAYRRYPSHPRYPSYARYPAYPTYYARPYYYRPYPYSVPVPFFLGFGYLPYY
jgi:hypothetical protein